MAKLIFIQPAGGQMTLAAYEGVSVMQAAMRGAVSGLLAECGGHLACATCHVYVVNDDAGGLSQPSEAELVMLEFTASPRRPTSRLCCQIPVTEALDGCVFEIAPKQL